MINFNYFTCIAKCHRRTDNAKSDFTRTVNVTSDLDANVYIWETQTQGIGGSLDREEQGIGEEEQEQQQGRFLDEYRGRR